MQFYEHARALLLLALAAAGPCRLLWLGLPALCKGLADDEGEGDAGVAVHLRAASECREAA